MLRIASLAVLMLTGALASRALALDNNPNGGAGNSTVLCECTCRTSGGIEKTKNWGFSGKRGECQAFSGSNCRWTSPDGATNNGTLNGCDTVVAIMKNPVNGLNANAPTSKKLP